MKYALFLLLFVGCAHIGPNPDVSRIYVEIDDKDREIALIEGQNFGNASKVFVGNSYNYEDCNKSRLQYPTYCEDNKIITCLNYDGPFTDKETLYLFVLNDKKMSEGFLLFRYEPYNK